MMLHRRHDSQAPSGLYTRLGYITGHALPWEGYRIGQIVERPMDGLGHGVCLGASGSGKTVAMYAPIYYATVGAGWGSIMVDFKASAKTREAMRAAAKAAGKPFLDLQVGTRTDGSPAAFYDPFAWEGTPEEKASMLLSCFDMTTEGAASYYTSIAQGWLRFCFRLMDYLPLDPGESRMDFLIRMCTTAEAKTAVKKVARTNPQAAAMLTAAMGTNVGDKDLAGLRSQLQNIADPLAPNLAVGGTDMGRPVFDPTALAATGAIGYVSISAANESVVQGVGTLVLQHLTSVMQVRMRRPGGTPMLIVIDEASALSEKATVVETLLKQAREADMWVWLASQQLSAWPESVQTAILGNTSTLIMMRADDADSAQTLSMNSGVGILDVQRREVNATLSVGGERQAMGAGKQRSVEPGHPLIEPGELQALPPFHGYVLFRTMPGVDVGSGTRQRRVPATPRNWTRNPRLNKGWEAGFTYDAPIVAIVPPAVMLDATRNVTENPNPITAHHATDSVQAAPVGAPADFTPLPSTAAPQAVTAPTTAPVAAPTAGPAMSAAAWDDDWQAPAAAAPQAPAGGGFAAMGDPADQDDLDAGPGATPFSTRRRKPAQPTPATAAPAQAPMPAPEPFVEVLPDEGGQDEQAATAPAPQAPAAPAWGVTVDD